MKMDKVRVVLYSMYLNQRGYTILRNPKGTPSTVVRAIKYRRGINDETMDTFETYERVTKNLDKNNRHKTKEFLFRDNFAFFNHKTKEIDYKKEVKYHKISSDSEDVVKHKSQIGEYNLDKRNLSYVDRLTGVSRDSHFGFIETVSSGNQYISSDSLKTFGELTVDKFYSKPKTVHQNFIDTLSHNLNNK